MIHFVLVDLLTLKSAVKIPGSDAGIPPDGRRTVLVKWVCILPCCNSNTQGEAYKLPLLRLRNNS